MREVISKVSHKHMDGERDSEYEALSLISVMSLTLRCLSIVAR